ncbi:prostate stem cell antigen-like [Mantella aurantiaca]
MNKWIAICFFALLACHLGDALECYSCSFGTCILPQKKTCALLEVCKTETARTGDLYLKKKSCSAPTQCEGETEDSYLGVKVKTKPDCCFTDLCNSAVTTSASFATAIAVLVSLWVAKLL